MSLDWPESPPWSELAHAVSPALDPALDRLSLRPGVLPALVAGPATPSAAELPLDPTLLGPALRTPEDEAWAESAPAGAAPLALDRFRRTIGLILEGVALRGLAEAAGEPLSRVSAHWWARGRAALAVHRADPMLGWLWPEAVDLLRTPERSLLHAPRRAAWLFHWAEGEGLDWSAGEPPLSNVHWQRFGAWLRDPSRGPRSQSPLPLPAPRGAEPCGAEVELEPLSHRALRFEAGPPGMRIQGDALPAPVLLAGGENRTVLLSSLRGGPSSLNQAPAGPVGNWMVESGSGAGRLFAAEGLDLSLDADGSAELVADNAFAGPVNDDSLKLARQFGATGSGSGSWRVLEVHDEGGVLELHELSLDDVTVHPRMTRAFSLPGKSWLEPVQRAMKLLSQTPLRFRTVGDKLHLEGEVNGLAVTLNLRRESD